MVNDPNQTHPAYHVALVGARFHLSAPVHDRLGQAGAAGAGGARDAQRSDQRREGVDELAGAQLADPHDAAGAERGDTDGGFDERRVEVVHAVSPGIRRASHA